jgi:hypothetical protein
LFYKNLKLFFEIVFDLNFLFLNHFSYPMNSFYFNNRLTLYFLRWIGFLYLIFHLIIIKNKNKFVKRLNLLIFYIIALFFYKFICYADIFNSLFIVLLYFNYITILYLYCKIELNSFMKLNWYFFTLFHSDIFYKIRKLFRNGFVRIGWRATGTIKESMEDLWSLK